MTTMDTQAPTIASSCATDTWTAISELFKVINKDFKLVCETIRDTIQCVLSWIYNKIICPTAATGVNILGYLFDKILLGSPSLRQYFHHGAFPNDISPKWRQWVKDNSGWDIYETMGKIPSDLFGVLGGGIGIFTLFNHFTTSYCYLTYNYSNIIVEAINGTIVKKIDERNLPVKIIFGILAAPIVIPSIIESNILSCFFQVFIHTCESQAINFQYISHLLGEYGSFGKRSVYVDTRCLVAKIIFGILSAPGVICLALITNTIDCLWTFRRHVLKSFGWNLRATFNLLGPYGIFGAHRGWGDDNDNRHLAVRIVFGIFSAPLVLPFAIFTNLLDFSLTAIKHLYLSYRSNLRMIFNALGKHGVFGPHRKYDDKRHIVPVIIFGTLTAPLVVASAILTNLVDFTLTGLLHTTISSACLIGSTYNIVLGEHGIFGKRCFLNNDSRNIAMKIIFGIACLPIVVPVVLFTNALDLACTFSKDFFASFSNNLGSTFNLLGKDGIFWERWKFNDSRPLSTKIIYGILSFPFVFPVALLTNVIDFSCSFMKNLGLSYHHNLRVGFNFILGPWGMFGARRKCNDTRGLLAKITFGILSGPFVVLTAFFSNLLDLALTTIYQTFASFFRNIRATFNIVLGRDGMFKRRRGLDDNRMLATKIVFGIVTAVPVALVSLATNLFDIACSTLFHTYLSFGRNMRVTFNILLGCHGVFGHRRRLVDGRGLATKIIFGIISAPLVALTSIVTNAIDLVGTFFKNWRRTIKTPVMVVTGLLATATLALPVFALRKVGKGIYNVFARPIVDTVKGRPFMPLRIVKGALNTVTLGAFSAVKKVFEVATGYSSRFGMPSKATTVYNQTQQKFRTAIEMATKAKFPGIKDDLNFARPLMRTLFHMRHQIEDILKTIHNLFQEYVREVKKKDSSLDSPSLSMFSFFISDNYKAKREVVEKEATADEKQMWDKAEVHLFNM